MLIKSGSSAQLLAALLFTTGVWSGLCSEAAPLTEEECVVFAKKVEEGIQQGDATVVNNAFDIQGFLDRASAGLGLNEKQRKELASGPVLANGDLIGKQLVGQVATGAQYKFLRVREVDREMCALFRISRVGTVNYQLMYLSRGAKGITITDLFSYETGEPISVPMRRLFTQIARRNGWLGNNKQMGNEYVRNMETMMFMTRALQNGEPEKVLLFYKELPKSVKRERMFMLLRLRAAQRVGKAECLKALKDFEDTFGKGHGALLPLFAAAFDAGLHDKALELLMALEKEIGPDAYIHAYRSSVWTSKNNARQAMDWANKAIELEPDCLEGYASLLTVLLKLNRFDEAKDLMLKVERNDLGAFDDLKEHEEFAGFVASPEYQKWLEQRPKLKRDDISEIPSEVPGAPSSPLKKARKSKRSTPSENAAPIIK